MTLRRSLFLILNISFVVGFSGILSDNEKSMTGSFINQLNIRSCIILKEHQEKMDHFNYYKTFFKYKITSIIYRRSQLKEYVNVKSFNLNGVRMMIFVKTSSLEKLVPFLRKIERFLHLFIWLIVLDQAVYYQKIPEMPVPYNCKFIIAQTKEVNKYELTEIYNTYKSFFKLDFGIWEKNTGLKLAPNNYFSKKRFDFNGTRMILLGNKTCPTVRECFHREIWDGLGYMLNFRTLTVSEMSKDGLDAKSIPRLFNSVAYKYDTIRPILKIKVYIFIRQPIEKGHPNYYTQPFTAELWLATLLWLIFATIFLAILKLWQNRHIKEKEISVIDVAFVPFETFCNQGGSNTPKQFSLRMAYFFARILAIFVIPAYSAFLVTYLRIRTPVPPFNDLETFVKIGTYKLGWVNAIENSYDYYYFKRSNDPLLNVIGENFLIPKREIKNQTCGLTKMCKEKYAHMGYVEDIRQTKAPCSVFRIKAPVYTSFTAIPLQLRTPYRKIFNMKLMKFYENGILHKMQTILDEWYEDEAENQGKEEYPPVQIQQMTHVLAIIPLGIVISYAALIFEWMYKQIL